MYSLEPEIARLRQEEVIDDLTAARLLAHERRDVVSLYGELRFLTWIGVTLIAAGVSVLVSRHLDRIGPLAIAAAIALAAGACYAWAVWKRGRAASLVDDYILLLGSLLLSADVGFIEHQWHLLDSAWARHFLLLALVHGAVAYWFGSRLVLSLSISALAAYLGVERNAERLFSNRQTVDLAIRAFLCAAIVMVWRAVDKMRRARRGAVSVGPQKTAASGLGFTGVFDHSAITLAFWGSLFLVFDANTRLLGCFVAIVLAVFSGWYGVRSGRELFVMYAWIYGMIAIDIQICDWLNEQVLIALYLVISTVAAIVGLFITHARLRRASA